MDRRKLLAGLLLLALIGVLFSAGALGPAQWNSGVAQPAERMGSGSAHWGGGRDGYRTGGAQDGSAARDRNAYGR